MTLKMMDDVMVASLYLLFDTVHHSILLQTLEHTIVIKATALHWFGLLMIANDLKADGTTVTKNTIGSTPMN